MRVIKCEECGREFEKNTNKIFCSPHCKNIFTAKRQKFGLDWRCERTCSHCKKNFIPRSTNQKFCSTECSKIINSFIYKAENGYHTGFTKIRFEVFVRDKFTCQYCGRNVKDDKIKLHCDHIIPKSKGGLDKLSNLVTSCEECNIGKGDTIIG